MFFAILFFFTLTTRFHVGKEAWIKLFITVKVCIRYSWQNWIVGARSSWKQSREKNIRKKKQLNCGFCYHQTLINPQILKIILAFRLCAIKINPNFLILSHPLPPQHGDPNKMCTLLIFVVWKIHFSSEAAAVVRIQEAFSSSFTVKAPWRNSRTSPK